MLAPGRRIWHIVHDRDYGIKPFKVGPKIIVGKLRFHPAGKYKHESGHWIDRKKSLIQVYTDPGGFQTLAAADIHFKDPGANLE